MSIDIDEMKKIRQMIQDFLYAVHGYGIVEVDIISVKKEENRMKIHGSFKKMTKKFGFDAEFDNDGRLLSYERVTSELKS